MQITPDVLLYPFRSDRWKEVFVIGGVLGFVASIATPIMILFPGFGLRAMRQAIRGDAPTLPTWNEFGQLFKDSLWYLLVLLVYQLPSILISLAMITFMMFAFMAAPFAMVGASRQAEGAFALIFVSVWVIAMIAFALSSLLTIPLQFLAFIGLTRAVAHDSLSAAFEVKIVWELARTNFLNFALAYATTYTFYSLGIVAAGFFATSLICSPLYYPALALAMMSASLVGSVLYGLAYRHAQDRFSMAGVIA